MSTIRRIAAATAAAAAISAVTLTGASTASATVHPAGFSAVQSCTGVNGQITYTPGLTSTAKTQTAVLIASLTGCTGFAGAQAGTGTLTAVLTGSSKVGAVVETGNATINWPASSGLNPSNVNLTIRQTTNGGTISASGTTTSGAFTGSFVSTTLLPFNNTGTGTKSHPLTAQTVINTLPLTTRVNFG
jgi:hypothetical protein